jgi:hypothetical protein
MSINDNFEFFSINILKPYAFEIIAFPEEKIKYRNLERIFNDKHLILSEESQGKYLLERRDSSIDAKMIVSPNLYDEQNKQCEITITYAELGIKYSTKKVVEFAQEISSKMGAWTQMIVWFTDERKFTEWIIPKNKVKIISQPKLTSKRNNQRLC